MAVSRAMTACFQRIVTPGSPGEETTPGSKHLFLTLLTFPKHVSGKGEENSFNAKGNILIKLQNSHRNFLGAYQALHLTFFHVNYKVSLKSTKKCKCRHKTLNCLLICTDSSSVVIQYL